VFLLLVGFRIGRLPVRNMTCVALLFFVFAGCRQPEAQSPQEMPATDTTASLPDDLAPIRPDDEQVADAPAAGTASPDGTSSTTAPAVDAPATARTGAPQQEIVIESVVSANPLVVKGRARTFENAVTVRVRDLGGAVVAEAHVTSVGESGQHNPFEAQVWLVRDPGARVTVEAFEFSAKDGSVRSLATKAVRYDVAPISLVLTFPRGDCTKFGTFTRRAPKSIAMARLLVEALLAGPTATETKAGATSPFPSGSGVHSVILRNGVMTVDLDDRLRNVGGACAATAIRESLTRTLKQLPTVKQVVVTAGGSAELALQP
jgi:hypothetical protein